MSRIVVGLLVLLVGCGAQPRPGGRSSSGEKEPEAQLRSELPNDYVRPSPYLFWDNCFWLTAAEIEFMIIDMEEPAQLGMTYEQARQAWMTPCYDDPEGDCIEYGGCVVLALDAVYHQ